MRRLAWLVVLAVTVWWFIRRRDRGEEQSATIGYADGSAVTLDAGAPERDRLLQVAAGALQA